jgi:hypothetical protein
VKQPKLHEVHQLLSDLLTQGKFEQAYQLTAKYMEPLGEGFLRFNFLCLAARLGEVELALDWLEESLHSDHWFSVWFLRRSSDLRPLFNLPRFKKILQELEGKRKKLLGRREYEAPHTRPAKWAFALPFFGGPTREWFQYFRCGSAVGVCASAGMARHLSLGSPSRPLWQTLVGSSR